MSVLTLALVTADVLNGPRTGLCVAAGAVGLLLAATVAIDRL